MNIIPFSFPEEWETLEIYPLSDLHIGDPKTDIPMFRRFVKMIQEQPNRMLVFNGDGLNNALKNSVSNVYNDSMPPNEQRKFLVEELKPIKDRFLCFVAGNHESRSSKETDLNPIEWIAESLGCPHYSDEEMALKISFGKKDNCKPASYGVWVLHGSGGGKRPGSALNNLELYSLTLQNADVVIMGHIHKPLGYRFSVRDLDLQNNVVRQIEKLCVVSASWASFGGYAAKKMMIPGAMGQEPIILSGKVKKARAII